MVKIPPLKPWPLPKFKPLYINNWDDYGLLNLLYGVNPHNPFKLSSLFFIDEVVNKLVK